MQVIKYSLCGALCALTAHAGCGGAEEAVTVQLPVVIGERGIAAVSTDLGYEVALTEARVMVRDLTFAVAGEEHSASVFQRSYDFMVPAANAHPGHSEGGNVTGELPGRFVLDWFARTDSKALGTATLLAGNYTNANFVFERATWEDLADANRPADEDDPLLGHTAVFRGTALKGDKSTEFLVVVDAPRDRELVGIPFEFEVRENSTETLVLELCTLDPLEGDTLFDGIDFAAVDQDGDGVISLSPQSTEPVALANYNLLRRTLMTHDQYEVTPHLEVLGAGAPP